MQHDVRVTVEQRQPVHVFWLLVLVCLVVAIWKWLVLGALAVGIVALAMVIAKSHRAHTEAQRQRVEGFRQRADEQHNWVFSGDPRGMYGHDWRGSEGSQSPSTSRWGPVPKPRGQRQRRSPDGELRAE